MPALHSHLPALWLAVATALAVPGSAVGLELEDCQLVGPGGFGRVSARCGALRVPEDPAAPDGQAIELFVAVVPALSRNARPDAFAVIAGGPGQASSEFYVGVAGAFRGIRRERDIVLVDQRGTGRSNALACTQTEEDPTPWQSPSAERLRESVQRCLVELPGDPRRYTTSIAVRDLDAVRAALGYEAWNLYGVSYGSRVALHHLRRYPETTRAVVLDGVAPADLPLGPEISRDAQSALDALFRRCRADAACAERFPALEDVFASLVESIRASPQTLVLDDPLVGEPVELVFGPDQLGLAVRLLSYAPETAALLPILIWDAAHGRPERLAAQTVLAVRSLGESMSMGMHHAIVCTEDVPFYTRDAIDRDAMARDYLGTRGYDLLVETCRAWPRGEIDPDFKLPVVSERPVLLLSGEIDPVTPPSNGERASATLANSLHVVGPGQGHGLVTRGCVGRLVADFIESGGVDGLDASCVGILEPAPFFVRLSGPEP